MLTNQSILQSLLFHHASFIYFLSKTCFCGGWHAGLSQRFEQKTGFCIAMYSVTVSSWSNCLCKHYCTIISPTGSRYFELHPRSALCQTLPEQLRNKMSPDWSFLLKPGDRCSSRQNYLGNLYQLAKCGIGQMLSVLVLCHILSSTICTQLLGLRLPHTEEYCVYSISHSD